LNARPQPVAQQRRSQRILLSISILVSGQKANGSAFSERTKTHVVNAHGALIHLRESVLAGQELRVKNLMTNEEITCTVVNLNAGSSDIPEVGLAFPQSGAKFLESFFSSGRLDSSQPGR
jgi:hypothetical protein